MERSNDIYLMPFTARAVLVYHVLKRLQFNIAGFFDNAKQLEGKTYCDTLISTPFVKKNENSIIVLCEPRFFSENRLQIGELLYTRYTSIKDIIRLDEAQEAVDDVDVQAFSDLVPAQFNTSKAMAKHYTGKRPDCLFINKDFAVSVAPLVISEDGCVVKCYFHANESESYDLVMRVLRTKRAIKPVIAILAKSNPFGVMKTDGYMKAVLATDEILADSCMRLYIEKSSDEFFCKGISVTEIKRDVVSIHYSCHNLTHINEIRDILNCSDLIYVHSIYYYDEEILNGVSTPIVYDIHGVVPEETEYTGNMGKTVELYQSEALAFSSCRLFICRNEAMMSYYHQKYKAPKCKMMLLPSISEATLPKRKHLCSGSEADERISIVYSGGTVKWQLVPMMLEGISRRPEYHYIVASSEVEKFNELTEPLTDNDIEVLYVEPDLLKNVYRRAQYGFVLRDDIIINRVACPTKLVDYCAYGVVPIMLSDRIGDFGKYGLRFVYYYDFLNNRLPDEKMRLEMAEANYQIVRKMAEEYDICKRGLLARVLRLAKESYK